MGKKSHNKHDKKKPTKKDIKQMNHLRLIQGKKGSSDPASSINPNQQEYKKAA